MNSNDRDHIELISAELMPFFEFSLRTNSLKAWLWAKKQDIAYADAGYTKNKGNSSTLKNKPEKSKPSAGTGLRKEHGIVITW